MRHLCSGKEATNPVAGRASTRLSLPSAPAPLRPVAELAQRVRVLAPVPAHLDPELEEDGMAGLFLDLGARLASDLAQHGAALADDDRLLRLVLDMDHDPHVVLVRPALDELLGLGRDRVRHFLFEVIEYLLAHDLGCELRLRCQRWCNR